MKLLTSQITRMVALLHNKGFFHIYLYAGLSPSGCDWRYIIGHTKDGKWPTNDLITYGSINSSSKLTWSEKNTTKDLCNDFINYFKLEKYSPTKEQLQYIDWYSTVVNSLAEDEAVIFYADYQASHQHLLNNAPGFVKK
ncbi:MULTISPECIES: hypothetical protein [unclassified Pseudoalteromonas]|uniref:hypothetical protein n=1 Tax=unclassified Pseudoalteromonas TaxID=194690 RepID=UPI0004238575|nr:MULTISPECIES: hypothetical protein [unclassified Pseudoalteromonas]